MPDGLYDRDVLMWSERQADLLRRLMAGERVNELVDWANVIEEMEDVGRSELHGCQGNLAQALIHLLKLAVWPESRDVPHWGSELVTFLGNAFDHYTPSMKERLDLERLYDRALRSLEWQGSPRDRLFLLTLTGCPFTVSDLVAETPDIDVLLARLTAHLTSPSRP